MSTLETMIIIISMSVCKGNLLTMSGIYSLKLASDNGFSPKKKKKKKINWGGGGGGRGGDKKIILILVCHNRICKNFENR